MIANTKRRRLRKPIAALLLLLATHACTTQIPRASSHGIEKYPDARDLYDLAERYRVKHDLPALGIGITHEGRTMGLGIAGERTAGSGSIVTLDDTFDVASCAKSVTATIAAMMVEDGRVRWETTLAEAFPQLRHSMHPSFASATLEQLLRHRAGLAHRMNRNRLWANWNRRHAGKSAREQRLLFTAEALHRPPLYQPGTQSHYTSDAYIVAGALLESTAGEDWEELVRKRLFRPLGMETAAYGVASRGRRTATHVVGHELGWFGRSRSVVPDPSEYGAPPFGSPAGFLYVSVPDLLRYVDFHIQSSSGRSRLLRRASFERLHSPVNGERFALGWSIDVKYDGSGRVVERSLYHGGYSGRFRSNIWFVPETHWGTAIVMNHGRGDESITADIFYALLREFGLVAGAAAGD